MQMEDIREVDSFTIGGTNAGPSMPGPRLQKIIGQRILVNMEAHMLHVPTKHGWEIAQAGDRIILYSDDSLEVQHGPSA